MSELLFEELDAAGIAVNQQVAYAVTYKGYSVGEYFADIVVRGRLVVELKCADQVLQ